MRRRKERDPMKTFELEAQIEAAKEAAVDRIETVMMPGAVALCDARRQTDEYWIVREAKIDDVLRLVWRSQSLRDSRQPESRASTQVLLPANATPELLARLHALAVDQTAQIVRECAGKIAEMAAVAVLTVRAYEAVGR